MGKTLTLWDSMTYSTGGMQFRQGESQEVADETLLMRLIDLGVFVEDPPIATYFVRATQGRYHTYIDSALESFTPEPRRVTRRVFFKLPFHEGKVERVYPAALMHAHPGPFSVILSRDVGAGDVAISLEVVHNLQKFFPQAEIHYGTVAPHRCLLEGHPQIAATHLLGDVNPFDFNFDIYLPRKSETAPDALSAVRADIYLRELFGEPLPEGIEHVTRLVLSGEEKLLARDLWQTEGKCDLDRHPKLVVQPRGSGTHRSLSPPVANGVIEAALSDGWVVAVIGQHAEHCARPSAPGFANLCGKTRDVRQAAAVIANADLVFSPDSAGYHLAAALDPPVPAAVLFTTVNPALRIRDYPKVLGLIGGPEALFCRPCGDRISCGGRMECVRQNDPAPIWEEVKAWWTCLPT